MHAFAASAFCLPVPLSLVGDVFVFKTSLTMSGLT
jgi:hypothetical protein